MIAQNGERDGDEPVELTEGEDYTEAERLDLADEDESLPWLESGEDDYEEGGVDTARLVGFALLGLLALAAIVGGIWYATNRGPDTAMVADGSTIEAPDTPVKSRPEDAEGTNVAGTGDVAPVAGEGGTTEARVSETAAPGVDVRRPGEAADAAPAASAGGGVGVQVGAYSTSARAEEGWRTLTGQSDALSGVRHRVVEGTADIGTVYRLQAVAGSVSEATALCNRLKADGIACQVKN